MGEDREGKGERGRMAVCGCVYVKHSLHTCTQRIQCINAPSSPHITLLPLPVCHSPSHPVVLPPPTDLTGTPVLHRGDVQLNWSPVDAVISGYQIMLRKSDSTHFSTYHSLIQGNTSVVISNLAVGERYDFKVKAKEERTDIAVHSFPSNVVAVETYSGEYHVQYCVTIE